MSNYSIQVYLHKLTCRDSESINSSDRFGLAGAATTDLETLGFAFPAFRINDHHPDNVHRPEGTKIFDGVSSLPTVHLVFQAWDIDQNDSWVENEEDIKNVAKGIATAVKLVPGWGTAAGVAIAVIGTVVTSTPCVVSQALRPELRPLFSVSVHTGPRWSKQIGLQWRDVDFLTGLIAVEHSKSGHSRQVPMNFVVRSMLLDVAGQRQRPEDPGESVFRCAHRQADKFFPKEVERAAKDLVRNGHDASRLDGYTWPATGIASRVGWSWPAWIFGPSSR